MGDIRSAREIALEKADKIGKLSPEEVREKRREEHAMRGEVLARKYMEQGFYTLRDVKDELGKYKGEDLDVVTGSMVSLLIQSIGPDNYSRALEAIADTLGGEAKGICSRIESLFREQQELKQEKLAIMNKEITEQERERLAGLGISGPAVYIDVESTGEWQRISHEFDSSVEKAEPLKEALLDIIGTKD